MSGPPSGGWAPNGLCSLFVCDVASFGDPSRTDLDRRKVRMAFYDALRGSFDGDGIPLRDCYREDRGDGALVVVPPSTDTTTLLTSLADRLRAGVRQHNDVSAVTAQMQLRLAVHTGVVHSDGEGLVGSAVNHAFRILDAGQLRRVLEWTGADLALIASMRVHEDVIKHGLGLVDPGEYQRIDVRVKETADPAWIRVPGMRPPFLPEPVPPAPHAPLVIAEARVIPPAESTALDLPRLPAADTVVDQARDLDAVVERALDIRQFRIKHLRNQIVAELPLALATAVRAQRTGDERTDVYAIVRTCHEHPQGLDDLLRVVRQFAGDSAQVTELRKSIEALRQV
ncbi:MAG: effector-associated domain 2-containing protein [Actinomadura sp.]